MIENSWAFTDKIKEFSVSELSQKVKEILETTLGQVKVKGEISGLKIASSGHAYFNLKDNSAIVACTCWRPTLAKIEIPLNDGIEVIATGKITSYAGQSRYQLTIERIEPAGLGTMMRILNERKNKLKEEGLFNPANKKNLPFLPLKIGIITSLTGAVIKDIIHRIQDRCPTHIIIWPVTVQGETAANEVSNAIQGFNALESKFKPDLLIVARGGGSIEDLWPFNEEIVVRSAAASKIPLISAVGHETDYTLIDLAADKRAPTPTAAAEFAVPVVNNLKYTLNMHADRLSSSILALLNYKERTFNNFLRILKHPENYVNFLEQKTDELSFRLLEALPNLLSFKSTRLDKFNIERLNPTKILKFKFLQLSHQESYLIKLTDRTISNLELKLKLNRTLLASLDYKNVLKRGFALIQNEQGNLIVSKQKTSNNDKFNIKFYDGEIRVKKL